MLKWGYTPQSFLEAKTILIFKGGEAGNSSNWRPISICSIIRRVIERILEKKLRMFININQFQKGFQRCPGTYENTSIIAALLNQAKRDKSDLSLLFLDVVKAYDMVGHKHLRNTLNNTLMPDSLRNLIFDLVERNYTTIQANGMKSTKIFFHRGLLQGAPLSPILFNISIDFILNELSNQEVSTNYGVNIVSELPNLSIVGFADDLVNIGKNKLSAIELSNSTIEKLKEIGLQINPNKSKAIIIEKGVLVENNLVINDEITISGIKKDESIKYLGVSFKDELIMDKEGIIRNITDNIQCLISTSMFKPFQKLTILNNYIWPKVTYALQTAPLTKIKKTFLKDIDKLIKSSIKEIFCLPNDINNAFLYSPKENKGMGLIKFQWEAYIQQINIAQTLMNSGNKYVTETRNLNKEINKCIEILQLQSEVEEIPIGMYSSRYLRKSVRKKEFIKWCNLPYKGICLFEEETKYNKWFCNKTGLSDSEWISSIKIINNAAAVRGIPGRSFDGTHCRVNTCNEFESLAHVIGKCPAGSLLRNTRHNRGENYFIKQK